MSDHPTRRNIIIAGAAAASGLALPGGSLAQSALPLTPACGDQGGTPRQTEGPFFTPNSPQRQSLIDAGMRGQVIEVSGVVQTRQCRPIAGALADFWQADAQGAYDNSGFRLRGHQFTDGEGRYRLRTIMPARYTGRTAHIHVKVQAPNRPVLTTQLYFPDEPGNTRDFLYRPELQMRLSRAGDVWQGRFDFVIELA
jgi:protocatechuate 3,4-dioxygenase beta subunit